MPDFKERRKFDRFNEYFMLFFSLKGDEGVLYEMSQVNNISRGGIHFSSNKHLPKGAELRLHLTTPFSKDVVQLQGKILECHEKLPQTLYGIRLEFTNISPQAADALVKIESWAKSAK